MEFNVLSTSSSKTAATVTSADVDVGFVQHQLEAMVIGLCVASLVLIVIIIWLIFKLCSCGDMLSSSRSSSQSSLYSNASDSPYQWRSLSVEVPKSAERGNVHVMTQNKVIQRLLDIRSATLKDGILDAESSESPSTII